MTAATSYWDLSERERAALTRENVEQYLAFELMQKGCGLMLTAPDLVPVPEPAVQPRDYYGVVGDGYYGTTTLFESREQAEQFLKLKPLTKKHDHLDGAWIDHAQPVEQEIKVVQAIAPDDFQTHRSALQATAKARAENEQREKDYAKAIQAQEAALKGLWDDWFSCGRKALAHDKVKRTWEQYVLMAGSRELAAKFLLKAFTREQVTEAAEWFGIEIPLPPTDVEAAVEAAQPTPAQEPADIAF